MFLSLARETCGWLLVSVRALVLVSETRAAVIQMSYIGTPSCVKSALALLI